MYIELLEKKRWCVLAVMIFAVVTVFFGYMNFRVIPGSIVDDAIMAEDDIVNRGEGVMDELSREGLKPGDAVMFRIPFLYRGEDMQKDLAYVAEFTEKLNRVFPGYKVWSLSNLPRFRDRGDHLDTESYINKQVLSDFRPDRWKQEVKKDSKIPGVFISPDFTSANVVLTLPRGYNEMEVSRQIMEFLMGEELAWYEWYLTDDITLADEFLRTPDERIPAEQRINRSGHERENGQIEAVLPAGWVLGRVLMTGAFYSSLFHILSFSLGLAALVFWVSFGNIRQTGIALCCLLSGLIWARGSVGLLQEAGVEIQGKMLYETVYFSLVFTSLIVSGISFVERKFDSYNETRKKHPGKTRAQVWAQTKANPAELIDERIIMTGLVAIFGFGTLYQVEIRQIMEVGIFSAIGLTFMLILTLYLVPALHILAGGEFRLSARSLPGKWWLLLDKTVKKCYQWSCPKGEDTSLSAFHRRGVKAGAGVAALAILVAGVIGAGALSDGFEPVKVKTEPLEFIQETLLYKASQDVNKPGEYGFDRAMFILRPAENARSGPAIYRPKFLQKAEDLQTGLEADPVLENHVRYIHSAVDMVKVVSRENYGHRLPRTKGQAVDSFRLLRAELGMPGQQQLWSRNGLVIYASTSATDSNAMETVVNRTLEVANRDFPELRVDTFGKVATYAGADKYLRERQAANTATQIFWIFLFTAVWIGWRNWRFRRKEQPFFLSSYGSGLAISLPFIFASTMMAIVIMIFKIPFDQATACITALTVNAAIDFSLYVVADYQAGLLAGGNRADGIKYAVLTRGRVVLIDMAINSACFAPLMLSPFVPIARIGWMMMVMLAFCGFGAMVILPTVLPLATRPNK